MHAWGAIAFSLLVSAAAGLTAGCATPEELAAQEVCDAFCTCEAPLPGEHTECTVGCEAELAGEPLPEACVACAQESACFELADCFDSCFGNFEEEP
jgi:hypothetical protein